MKTILALLVAAIAALAQVPLTSPYQDYDHRGGFDLSRARVVRIPYQVADPSGTCLDLKQVVYAEASSTFWVCRLGTWTAITGSGSGSVTDVTVGPSGKLVATTPVAGTRQIEAASTVPTTDTSTSWTGAFNLSGSSATRSFKEVATAPSGACVAADGQRLVTSGANIGELYACLNSLWTMIARSALQPRTYWDDFVSYGLGNNQGPYYAVGSGISITRTEEGGESGTVGVMSISPGSPSWAYISSAANTSGLAAANIASAELNTYVARIRLDTADTSFGGAFGISVLSGWPNPNGMYIEKLKADTSWYCVAKDGGGTTRSSAITATTNTYVWLKVRRTASGVACSIATTYLGLIGATEYTVTANIPTGAMGMFLMADTSAASRKLYIDGWGIDAPAR